MARDFGISTTTKFCPPFLGNGTHQSVNATGGGTLAVSDHDQIFAQHQQIATLNGNFNAFGSGGIA